MSWGKPKKSSRIKKMTAWLRRFGPGLVSGSADADPSGIGTYTQAGAQFRFRLIWVETLSLPCMIGIQTTVARIGRTTGRGLAANLKLVVPKWLLVVLVSLLTIANTINLAADLGAMGASLKLVTGFGSKNLYAVLFAAICLALPMWLSYRTYSRILVVLCLSLFAYLGSVFVLKIPWSEFLPAVVLPRITWDKDYLVLLAGILGTDITPFMFFWQAGHVVEEIAVDKKKDPLIKKPEQARQAGKNMWLDTVTGMSFNIVISWFVVLTAGLVLHDKGLSDVQTATEAASSLAPVAGKWAEFLFAAGIIGTGLLAVPVMAGSSGFAVGDTFEFKVGYRFNPRQASKFYAIVAGQIVVGTALNFIGINPMKALVYAAAVNAVMSVPLMVATMIAGMSKKIMKNLPLPKRVLILGWFSTAVMLGATILMGIAYLKG